MLSPPYLLLIPTQRRTGAPAAKEAEVVLHYDVDDAAVDLLFSLPFPTIDLPAAAETPCLLAIRIAKGFPWQKKITVCNHE